jgi:DNA polymerase-4
MARAILYADVPAFYAEVERAVRPELAGRPVIVGGDPRKRGLVQAATPDAVAAGVLEGMAVVDALAQCPRARAVRTEMSRYREMDKRLRACLARACERLEPAGLGAAFLEAGEGAGPTERSPALSGLARALREAVAAELGLPLRVGSGPVKFVARLAAEEAGGVGFLAVAPGEVAAFLGPLPVSRLPGVGPNTAARLAELGVSTVAQLVALGRGPIESALGNHGLVVLASALGQGDDRLRPGSHPQTLSQEVTLRGGGLDRAQLGEQLRLLAERLERALALEGLAAKRLLLKVRYADGARITRSVSLELGVATAQELVDRASELLERTQAGSRPLRLLGLAVSSLARPRRDDRQLPLFRV